MSDKGLKLWYPILFTLTCNETTGYGYTGVQSERTGSALSL